jgi:hypothetical protein
MQEEEPYSAAGGDVTVMNLLCLVHDLVHRAILAPFAGRWAAAGAVGDGPSGRGGAIGALLQTCRRVSGRKGPRNLSKQYTCM